MRRSIRKMELLNLSEKRLFFLIGLLILEPRKDQGWPLESLMIPLCYENLTGP